MVLGIFTQILGHFHLLQLLSKVNDQSAHQEIRDNIVSFHLLNEKEFSIFKQNIGTCSFITILVPEQIYLLPVDVPKNAG